MRCTIWYHLYNLKNVKNIHEGVLLLVKLHASAAHHIYAALGYIFRILMHGYFLTRLIFKPDRVKGVALRKFCF